MKVVAVLIADAATVNVTMRGATLLAHALRGLREAGCVDRTVVSVPPDEGTALGEDYRVVAAAPTRAESIWRAFEAAGSCDVVLVHDAARAFVPPATIRAVAEAVFGGAEAAAPALPVTDTVKLVGPGDVVTATEDRARLRTVQTPFGFVADVLREACERGVDPLSSPPRTVRAVAGHPNGLRLATPFDVAVAEALLNEEGVRS